MFASFERRRLRVTTKVLDLDISSDLPETIKLPDDKQALILFRFRGLPVGRVWASVKNGSVQLSEALVSMADWPLWEAMLNDVLGFQPVPSYSPGPATVAICTRDRPQDVDRCLQGLLKLTGDPPEILLIDNCPSSDATHQIALRYGDRVRYVREEIAGLNRARNRALKEARHEIVAFTDDDTVTDPAWLTNLLRNFYDPMVMCVTGLTMPLELETEAQEWFERHSPFCRGFLRKEYDLSVLHPLASSRVGAGANMALRREALQQVGPFDEALDAGTPTRSGGDTEMFSRILANGYRIVYDPAALSWHRHRSTWSELIKAIYGYGVGAYAIFTKALFFEGEWFVPALALQWFFYDQLPKLIRSLVHWPGSFPLAMILAELRGCLAGPQAYLASRTTDERRSAQSLAKAPR